MVHENIFTDNLYVNEEGKERKKELEIEKRTGDWRKTSNFYDKLMNNKIAFIQEFRSEAGESGTRFRDCSGKEVEIANQFDAILTVLNEKYVENWDIHYELAKENRLLPYIVLRYPEVTIENQFEKNHLIKEIYIYIPLIINDNFQLIATDIRANRFEYTIEEWYSGYRHSHLPTRSTIKTANEMYYANSFCMGSGTDLDNLINEIFLDSYYTFNSIAFETLLYNIDSLLEWESEEGVPYIRISAISLSNSENQKTIPKEFSESICEEYIEEKMIRNLELAPSYFSDVKTTISDSKLSIVIDQEFIDMLIPRLARQAFGSKDNHFLVTLNLDENASASTHYLAYEEAVEIPQTQEIIDSLTNDDGEKVYFIFRDIERYVEITSTDTVYQTDERTYNIHPSFLKHFTNIFNKYINEKAITRSLIRNKIKSLSVR